MWNIQNLYEENDKILLEDLKAWVNRGLIIIKINSSKIINLVQYQFNFQLNYFEIWQTDSEVHLAGKTAIHITTCIESVELFGTSLIKS